jgi:carboxypeptidase Taq
VRITTKYHVDKLTSSVYSVIHECGHALYEQNMSGELERYGLARAASMGMHESQSRLFENMICRSRAFAGLLLPKLLEQYDYFAAWDEEMLYRAVNIARPSLIRIEADELTYSLHIMVRYELEKGLMTGEIKPAELPGLWDDKFEEILGIRPGNMASGVLQDVHWNRGLVGYFPSYAVGTAYGAQIVNAMRKSVDIDAAIRNSDLSPVSGWLKENIHRHGAMLLPDDLLRQATGEPFDPKYYVTYLSDKFTALYL